MGNDYDVLFSSFALVTDSARQKAQIPPGIIMAKLGQKIKYQLLSENTQPKKAEKPGIYTHWIDFW